MGIERNVGGTDRSVRALLPLVALLVAGWAVLENRPGVATVAGLSATGLLFNAVVGFCGVNALLGVDTCSRDGAGD